MPHHHGICLPTGASGVARVEDTAFESPGIHYLTLTDQQTGASFVSSPVRVATEHDQRVYWGDIHLHSYLPDGVGDADREYRFGRDVMALNFAAYTDHDTMGFLSRPDGNRPGCTGSTSRPCANSPRRTTRTASGPTTRDGRRRVPRPGLTGQRRRPPEDGLGRTDLGRDRPVTVVTVWLYLQFSRVLAGQNAILRRVGASARYTPVNYYPLYQMASSRRSTPVPDP